MGLTIVTRELTTGAEAWALGPAWDNLVSRAASNVLFLTRPFQTVWWEQLGEGQVRVIVGQADGAVPLFIAPLCISQVPGLGRTVRQIGGSEVADYLDILAAPDDMEIAWRLTLERLRQTADTWDTIDLRALPAWSPSRVIVGRLAPEFGWSVGEMVDEVCPLIALPTTWEGYLARLSKKDRHELRRKIGRLERHEGGERFTMIGPDDDLEAAIADFLALHRRSGEEKDAFWNERLVAFFRRLIPTAQAEGWLRLAFQEVGGARAAVVLAFRYGDRYYVYNSGYDPAYRHLSAGVVCMARTIQAAIAEGAAIFDLLQGAEPYKYDFGAVNTNVYRCVIRK